MARRRQAGVNALAWAPHSSCHICTAGDDSQALIWDLSSMSQPLDQGLGALRDPAASVPSQTSRVQCASSCTTRKILGMPPFLLS